MEANIEVRQVKYADDPNMRYNGPQQDTTVHINTHHSQLDHHHYSPGRFRFYHFSQNPIESLI